VIATNGAQPQEDLAQLWRGSVLRNICVSNTDDHLRNHGFLLGPVGDGDWPGLRYESLAGGQRTEIEQSTVSTTPRNWIGSFCRTAVSRGKGAVSEIIKEVTSAVAQWPRIGQCPGHFTSRTAEDGMHSLMHSSSETNPASGPSLTKTSKINGRHLRWQRAMVVTVVVTG